MLFKSYQIPQDQSTIGFIRHTSVVSMATRVRILANWETSLPVIARAVCCCTWRGAPRYLRDPPAPGVTHDTPWCEVTVTTWWRHITRGVGVWSRAGIRFITLTTNYTQIRSHEWSLEEEETMRSHHEGVVGFTSFPGRARLKITQQRNTNSVK